MYGPRSRRAPLSASGAVQIAPRETTSAICFEAAAVVYFWKALPQSEVCKVTVTPVFFLNSGRTFFSMCSIDFCDAPSIMKVSFSSLPEEDFEAPPEHEVSSESAAIPAIKAVPKRLRVDMGTPCENNSTLRNSHTPSLLPASYYQPAQTMPIPFVTSRY